MKITKRLNYGNKDRFFESDFEVGEYCIYDFDVFLWLDVLRLAQDSGIKIEYCRPQSFGYRIFGDATFIIKEINRKDPDPKIFHFDVNQLTVCWK
jgi:hypothetical protein